MTINPDSKKRLNAVTPAIVCQCLIIVGAVQVLSNSILPLMVDMKVS